MVMVMEMVMVMVDGRWSLVADTEQSSRGGSRLLAGNRGNEGTGRQTPAAGVAGSDRSSRPPVWWREKMVARIVDYDMCILTDASPSSTIPRWSCGPGTTEAAAAADDPADQQTSRRADAPTSRSTVECRPSPRPPRSKNGPAGVSFSPLAQGGRGQLPPVPPSARPVRFG
ncbi:hypothetical protein B2J93_6723 [Marssonina coronariae]|uniref:Uncharacterized protein n=1 Tax=Diplocarpon coronariae TaxID=2795749 RepID=A0A218ZHW2_9HELO|nr:hypothetical protein B2J93_6723 [Marssonina coronariae]